MRQKPSIETVDDRLRRLEILVAGLMATQAAMLAVGSWISVTFLNRILGGL